MRIALLLCALCALSLEAHADPLTITFDSLPTGITSCCISQGVSLLSAHTNTAGSIVNISGAEIRFSSQAHTPSNALFGQQLNPLSNLRNNVSGQFFLGGSPSLTPAITNFVSFHVVGTVPGQTASWTVCFYDESNNNLYDSTTGLIGTITGTTDTQVVFSYELGIRRFIFFPSGPNVTSEGIDTLQFNATTTPEPTTVLLLGTGLAGVGAVVRKRRRGR